jgi:hypothetical protein
MRKVRDIFKSLNNIVGYVILELGNDILKMLGVDEPVDDIGVFFRYTIHILTIILVMRFSYSILMQRFQTLTSASFNLVRQRSK